MTGGFAILAYPVEYRNSGIMTFMIGKDGTVYQKDLGEKTTELALRWRNTILAMAGTLWPARSHTNTERKVENAFRKSTIFSTDCALMTDFQT